ncbi:hypothetical protein RFI_05476 [Reticulomyxa filosa]|uniref:Uncharacterized protein n=1 Tax=Reticulomyxa filosa TaxID=46433 RepID=X6NZA4_RETFI|nr:hypothetical protein RFI_05476 [Reticulomyxa filosa]|eukprot:ETO31640.1 hypothetical protein RFI_05476 [Reticulomyxa filosa]
MLRIFLFLCSCILIRAMVADVPAKFKSSADLTSLFCSTCQTIVTSLNNSYYDDSANFDALFGFRLDSAVLCSIRTKTTVVVFLFVFSQFSPFFFFFKKKKGKKIRKQSDLLRISVAMEGICDNIQGSFDERTHIVCLFFLTKQCFFLSLLCVLCVYVYVCVCVREWRAGQYSTGKRKNGNLYLIPQETVEDIEANISVESQKKQLEYDQLLDSLKQSSEEDNTTDIEKEKEALPKHYHVKKPKLLKSTSKTHKLVQDMCFTVTDHLEEWLLEQEKLIKQIRQETKDNDKEVKIKFDGYCIQKYKSLCDAASTNLDISYFKLKMRYTRPPSLPTNEDLNKHEDGTDNHTLSSNDTDSQSGASSVSDPQTHIDSGQDTAKRIQAMTTQKPICKDTFNLKRSAQIFFFLKLILIAFLLSVENSS